MCSGLHWRPPNSSTRTSELKKRHYEVTLASPEGRGRKLDQVSDPRDKSRWSAEDLLSLAMMTLIEDTPSPIAAGWQTSNARALRSTPHRRRHSCRKTNVRASARLIPIMLALVIGTWSAATAAQQEVPAWVERGLPGPAHAQLEALEGTWQVEKSLYGALGTSDDPATSSDLTSRREWQAGGRFLRDETEGTIAGVPYWRLGLLGYSTMDERYEWVTIDAANANMMIYLGEPGSGHQMPITMSGVFTDQGMIGDETIGEPIGQRTVIHIENNDRHIVELYFSPPGGVEFLADRSVYTRVQR